VVCGEVRKSTKKNLEKKIRENKLYKKGLVNPPVPVLPADCEILSYPTLVMYCN
jgi:hypothetical protein